MKILLPKLNRLTSSHTLLQVPKCDVPLPHDEITTSVGPSVNLHCVDVHKQLFFLSVSNNNVAFFKIKKKLSEGLSSAMSTQKLLEVCRFCRFLLLRRRVMTFNPPSEEIYIYRV